MVFNKTIHGKWKERFLELMLKPILFASIYVLSKILRRLIPDERLDARAILWKEAHDKAGEIQWEGKGLGAWVIKEFANIEAHGFMLDNAYKVARETAIEENIKLRNIHKVGLFRERELLKRRKHGRAEDSF